MMHLLPLMFFLFVLFGCETSSSTSSGQVSSTNIPPTETDEGLAAVETGFDDTNQQAEDKRQALDEQTTQQEVEVDADVAAVTAQAEDILTELKSASGLDAEAISQLENQVQSDYDTLINSEVTEQSTESRVLTTQRASAQTDFEALEAALERLRND